MGMPAPWTDDALLRRASWTSLLAVLVGLLFFSYLFERPGGARLGNEASYLMTAESLAFDGDLTYTRADFDRHLLSWLGEPPALSLRSTSAGRHITYGVSPAYSLWLAPFVRLWPRQGLALANCLLLLLVGAGVAALWQRSRGGTAPALLGLGLFLSLLFCSPFVADGGLFLALATLLGFSLLAGQAYGGGDPASRRRRFDKGALAAGALLALPCADDLGYLVLPLAALWMVTGNRRPPLLLAFGLTMAVLASIPWLASGGLVGGEPSAVGAETQLATFTPATGFPLVDFGGDEWSLRLKAHGAVSQAAASDVGGATYAYAMVDRMLGRHLGILPWFPLAVPLFLAAVYLRRRRPVALAVLAWCGLSVWQDPFDLEQGGALWAAGRFLPLYAALLATLGDAAGPGRNGRGWRWWGVPWGLAVALALWTLPTVWASPWRAPLFLTGNLGESDGAFARPLELPWRQHLPQETTQRRLMRRGTDFAGVRWCSLDGRGWTERQSRRLVFPSDGPSHWLVASSVPLSAVDGPGLLAASGLALPSVANGPVMELELQPMSGTFGPRRHAVWWTHGSLWLYRLQATVRTSMPASTPPRRYLMLHSSTSKPHPSGPSPATGRPGS